MNIVLIDESTTQQIADTIRGMYSEMVTIETSNPGPQGYDTGYVFDSPRTKSKVRVMARAGENRDEAIARVRKNHGL
jgi:hypothetical protein